MDKKSVSIEEIWPQERDVIMRPERYKYVRKIVAPTECVFCAAAKSEISFESLCIYKSQHSMVVLNKYPYNSGHTLVLPLRHVGDLIDLSEEEYTDLSETKLLTLKVLKKVYDSSQGFNIGMNHGKIAGAGIPEHLHWHIIPRWLGDTNFFPLIGETKVLPESLEQSYEKIKEGFDEI